MNASELRSKSIEELATTLLELQQQQFTLRHNYRAGQLSNTDIIRKNRRDIARVNTILSEKLREEDAE